MNTRLTDKAEIPNDGERLPQTVLEIGKGKPFDVKQERKREGIVVKTIVDAGARKKKKLSCSFFDRSPEALRENQKFREFADSVNVAVPSGASSLEAFLSPFHEITRNGRFSALVKPREFETDQGRYVRYQQSFYVEPDVEREIHIQQEPTQFMR